MLFKFMWGAIFLGVCLPIFAKSSISGLKLATYVVKPDQSDVMSVVMTAHAQLTPVYKADGSANDEENDLKTPRLVGGRKRFVTETVYGFLDFTTTVGSTVMVFTPQSEIASPGEASIIVMSSVTPVTTSAPPPTTPQELSTPSEKSKRKTNAPTGLAKLLQEALLLKHSEPIRNTEKKLAPLKHFPAVKKVLPPKAPILESSRRVPEEVIVSAGQQLPSVSVLGPFNTEVNNELGSDLRYDYAISEPRPSANIDYAVVDIGSQKQPTGLVTTLGGTIIAGGQTTIHQTSVIGTYVGGQYAQVLKSTSKIFNASPVLSNLISPKPTYETVKAVIKGSATQFFKPDSSTSLPVKSLFTATVDKRKPRYEDDYSERVAALTKRGNNYYDKDYYGDDTLVYDEYDDLQRAGSGPRGEYKSAIAFSSAIRPSKTITRSQPSTFRHRYKTGATRNTPPSFLRNQPPPENRNRDRFRLSASKPKTKVSHENRNKNPNRPILKNRLVTQVNQASEPTPTNVKPPKNVIEETVRVATSRPVDGPSDIWYEIITLKSLHTYRIGQNKNTRYLTYTRTNTHTIEPTSQVQQDSQDQTIYKDPPLFENILTNPKEIATLPVINIDGQDLNTLLYLTTETFKTTETMYKTSVLPVQQSAQIHYYTLTQTYFITRIVSAVKTVPPFDQFIPSNSLNEFNDKLLAEGTENEDSLLPGEKETDENGEIRVRPPPGFKAPDTNLAELAAGKFNPEALEKQLNPQLAAAIQSHKSASQQAPQLSGTLPESLQNIPNASPTPALSPEALQMAYLRLMNPYMFGNFPGLQQQAVSSSPVYITTDATNTVTRVLKVILNARPILTTISSLEVVRTTITSYVTSTVAAAAPSLPGLGGFPFGAGGLPFAAG